MLNVYRLRPMYRLAVPVKSSTFRALSTSPPGPFRGPRWAPPNIPTANVAPDIASEDPVYQRLQKADPDYRQKQDAFGGENAQIFAKNKDHAANLTKDKEAALKLDQDDGDWFGMADERNSLENLAQGTDGRFYHLPADAGDPFGCDDAHMRQAKARSGYAWVTCETTHEKFVLQAKSRAYFCIERDLKAQEDDPGFPIYNIGFAFGRQKPSSQRSEVSTQFLDRHCFPFESRKVVFSTGTLHDAFRLADVLVDRIVKDGNLRAMMLRDRTWRKRICSLDQVNMLLRMQWAHVQKSGKQPADEEMSLVGNALTMDHGQVSSILTGLLFSRFDPQDSGGHRLKDATSQQCEAEPTMIAPLPRLPSWGYHWANNFWQDV